MAASASRQPEAAADGRARHRQHHLARSDDGTLIALCTNHALPQQPIQDESLTIALQHAIDPKAVFVERIDEQHANAKRSWEVMGASMHQSIDQVHRLRSASELQDEPMSWRRVGDSIVLELVMPPHAVAAVTLKF
jgi:xylan 1,4-beta-xylosidase